MIFFLKIIIPLFHHGYVHHTNVLILFCLLRNSGETQKLMFIFFLEALLKLEILKIKEITSRTVNVKNVFKLVNAGTLG